jgi:hypothetical protein
LTIWSFFPRLSALSSHVADRSIVPPTTQASNAPTAYKSSSKKRPSPEDEDEAEEDVVPSKEKLAYERNPRPTASKKQKPTPTDERVMGGMEEMEEEEEAMEVDVDLSDDLEDLPTPKPVSTSSRKSFSRKSLAKPTTAKAALAKALSKKLPISTASSRRTVEAVDEDYASVPGPTVEKKSKGKGKKAPVPTAAAKGKTPAGKKTIASKTTAAASTSKKRGKKGSDVETGTGSDEEAATPPAKKAPALKKGATTRASASARKTSTRPIEEEEEEEPLPSQPNSPKGRRRASAVLPPSQPTEGKREKRASAVAARKNLVVSDEKDVSEMDVNEPVVAPKRASKASEKKVVKATRESMDEEDRVSDEATPETVSKQMSGKKLSTRGKVSFLSALPSHPNALRLYADLLLSVPFSNQTPQQSSRHPVSHSPPAIYEEADISTPGPDALDIVSRTDSQHHAANMIEERDNEHDARDEEEEEEESTVRVEKPVSKVLKQKVSRAGLLVDRACR